MTWWVAAAFLSVSRVLSASPRRPRPVLHLVVSPGRQRLPTAHPYGLRGLRGLRRRGGGGAAWWRRGSRGAAPQSGPSLCPGRTPLPPRPTRSRTRPAATRISTRACPSRGRTGLRAPPCRRLLLRQLRPARSRTRRPRRRQRPPHKPGARRTPPGRRRGGAGRRAQGAETQQVQRWTAATRRRSTN